MIALTAGESTGRIIRHVDVDGAIVSTTTYPAAPSGDGAHYHENPHLCLLLRGTDVETCGPRSYRRQTGDLYFYPAGEVHATTSRNQDATSALVEFNRSFLEAHGVAETQLALAARENLNATFLILKMQQELALDDAHTPLAIHALALDLVHYSRVRFRRTPPAWVRRVADMLDQHWNKRLTLAELSAAAGAHPVTISKHFRKHFSCTLGEYRRRLMVRRSIPLVRESPMSLSEIAFACGFSDQSHFTRTFRQATGFLPNAFRRF